MKILHTKEKKEVEKNFKDTSFPSLVDICKKWKISFLSVPSIFFKEDEVMLMLPQISNHSDLLVHNEGSISGTCFPPIRIFKLESLSNCIGILLNKQEYKVQLSISILFRTKGGDQKHHLPVSGFPLGVVTAILTLGFI